MSDIINTKHIITALERCVEAHYNSTHPFHSPIWDDASLAIRELKTLFANMAAQPAPQDGNCKHCGGVGCIACSAQPVAQQDMTRDYYWSKVDARCKELESQNQMLLEALKELADLMEDTVKGMYTPDSFTTQPARAAIEKAGKS